MSNRLLAMSKLLKIDYVAVELSVEVAGRGVWMWAVEEILIQTRSKFAAVHSDCLPDHIMSVPKLHRKRKRNRKYNENGAMRLPLKEIWRFLILAPTSRMQAMKLVVHTICRP